MKKSHLTASLMLFASCLGLSAQSETMYERGATYLENTMPPSPEPASIVKYADVPFTHSTGMAEYDVPFYTLQGRELSVPIGLHYASGGIKLDEIAGVAGLGWTLQAGGCITRTVMDLPDEFDYPTFRHELPSGSLLSALEEMSETQESLEYLKEVLWHKVDASLDRYSYSVCGLSGSFVIKDDGSVFQLSGDGVLIDYTRAQDNSIDVFVLTGPDGTVYTLSDKETATHDGRGQSAIGPMNGYGNFWTAPTAWHITSMRSRSGLETAQFSYSPAVEWKSDVLAITRSVAITSGGTGNIPSMDVTSSYVYKRHHVKALTGISFNGTELSFVYGGGGGKAIRTSSDGQNNYPFTLRSISVSTAGTSGELSRLELLTDCDPYDGRIVLNGLRLYGSGELEDSWNFSYKGVGRTVSTGSQDWYGYYNGENEFTDDGTPSLCPYEYRQPGGLTLTNGFPNHMYADYMSLVEIDHDGAVTRFHYEGNVVSTSGHDCSVGVRVAKIILPEGMGKSIRTRYFTYEEPALSGPGFPSHDIYTTVSMTPRASGLAEFIDWSYSFHETPVALGPSIRDTRVYYGKVTEDVSGPEFVAIGSYRPDSNTSRTIYRYSTDGICPISHDMTLRFPSAWKSYYDGILFPSSGICSPWAGIRTYYTENGPSSPPVLARTEVYAYGEDGYRLVSSADYEYAGEAFGSVLVDYHVEYVSRHWVEGYIPYNRLFHYPIYAGSSVVRQPVRETRVGYHASGNDTTVVTTSYVPRRSLSTPVRVSSVTMTAGNVERQMSYGYADQEAPSGDWTSTLESQHCLSVPLRKGISYTENERSAISGDIAMPTSLPDFPDTIVHVDTPLIPPATPFKEEITQYGWFDVLGGQVLFPSAHIEKTLGVESWREDVLTRDSRGAITSVKEKGGPQTVILWGYSRRLPVAVIENASISEVYEALGGREVLIEASAGLDVPSDSYLQQLADLRTELPNAHVTTYTHIPGKGVGSVTDPADVKTIFEYDHAGRLTCIRDNDGNKVEEYDYSLMADADKRRHMRSRTFRSADGQQFSEDVRWWDVYGRTLQDISIAASDDGKDLVTAYGSDFMFHDDVKTWLPYPVQNTAGAFQTEAENAAAGYHGNDLAYSFNNYEMSSRDRVVSTALPGYAGEHETTFETDLPANGSFLVLVPHYEWKEDHVENIGWYSPDELVVEKTTDADGRVTKVCKDHFGKTIRTSVGNNGNTHYVYDLYDRLRAVMGSGIELSDTLNMWRYDYDSLGRMSSKGIPGSVREYYTYDDEDRVIAILRDEVLKEMEYDAFGRVLKVWQTMPGVQRTLLEDNMYDVYPSGFSGANPKGLKTVSHIAEFAPDGSVAGYVDVLYQYDSRKRPIKVTTHYQDGTRLVEEMEYTFSGEVKTCLSTYEHDGQADAFSVGYTYDQRGRLKVETATLTPSGTESQTAKNTHAYDVLGRPAATSSLMPNCPRLTALRSYTLQGWTDTLSVSLADSPLFLQRLGYDAPSDFSGHVAQYSGMVSMKSEIWPQPSDPHPYSWECYTYDHAGRLARSTRQGGSSEYTYDQRGNILSETLPASAGSFSYEYDGDRLSSLTSQSESGQDTAVFTHDALGRMTFDGTTGQLMTYNSLDLVGNISRNGTTLVNYSYLSDGTKLSALDGSGAGLVYRGPFVYRKSSGSNAGSSLTLESAAFGGGRMTPDGALLYVTDYLGSVRAVVNGNNGAIYKASDYSPYGEQSDAASVQTASTPAWITLRDAYTGQEDQHPDFGTGYTDFGARQYSPTLRRWMTPDPLSEKYYGTSPYVFCNDNPLRYVDPDGKDGWDVFIGHSIGLITNVIPGTGSLRDLYSPTDPSDYNLALRNSDLASFTIGDFLTKAGAAEAAFGGSLLAAGATSVSASGGVLVFVGGPAALIGAEELVRGALTAAGGGLMMMNSSKNQLDGYERGKPSNSNSDNKPKSINQLETDIKKGKAPKGFKHFHSMHTKGGQEHVHLEDGTSLNKDGSWKDGKNSQHKLTNKQIKYLQDNGWDI